jgi:hypothetical protein
MPDVATLAGGAALEVIGSAIQAVSSPILTASGLPLRDILFVTGWFESEAPRDWTLRFNGNTSNYHFLKSWQFTGGTQNTGAPSFQLFSGDTRMGFLMQVSTRQGRKKSVHSFAHGNDNDANQSSTSQQISGAWHNAADIVSVSVEVTSGNILAGSRLLVLGRSA